MKPNHCRPVASLERTRGFWLCVFLCLVSAAVHESCSAADETGGSELVSPDPEQAPGSTVAQPPSGVGSSPATLPPVAMDNSAQLVDDEASLESEQDECGRLTQTAELTPINLIMLFDSSGSMGDSASTGILNFDRRWTPARAGVLAFLENPGSSGIQASLKFFPHPGGFDTTCNPDNYTFPDVPLRSLDDVRAFETALDVEQPAGGTPMLPALMGAMSYAESVLSEDPSSKTMIVMVTDGEPAVIPEGGATLDDVDPACPKEALMPNTIAGVAEFVRSKFEGSPSIPTYVIGIGSSVAQLAAVAQAGGTEMVFIDDADPTQTRAALSGALESIRSFNFDCEIRFPELPEGEGVGKVNVDFVGSQGALTELEKATEACNSIGWTLDDEVAPSKITLCPQACAFVQDDPLGRLELTVGCATRVQQAR